MRHTHTIEPLRIHTFETVSRSITKQVYALSGKDMANLTGQYVKVKASADALAFAA
jgi:hypothetical protein